MFENTELDSAFCGSMLICLMIQRRHGQLYAKLDHAAGQACAGNVMPIVELAKNILARFGGELRMGFKMPMDGLPKVPITRN